MQRRMQNISFLVIVGVLLSCAYFFSEQTRSSDDPFDATPTVMPTAETREDIRDCSALVDEGSQPDCYRGAAGISERLVDNFSDKILSQQANTTSRIAFIDMQQAWEASRDADCEYIQDQAKTEAQGDIDLDKCLVDHNLARLDQLKDYFCDYDDGVSCDSSLNMVP